MMPFSEFQPVTLLADRARSSGNHTISSESSDAYIIIGFRLLAERLMGDQEMKIGVWFYGLSTALAGILDIAWGAFDASHQPIQSLGNNLPGQHVLAYVAGVWLIAAGLAILWRRSARIGAAASAIAYLIFAAIWLARYYAGIHALGWRIDVLAGVTFGLAQQIMLVAPAAIVYASTASLDSRLQNRTAVAARWMLGLPPVFFGLLHLIGIRVFASIVPHWMLFGYFWVVLTGIAFLLAGSAICSGIMDVLATRLIALMLLLFEGLVEIPPIFIRVHNQAAWGAAVYNLAAIGACWIFAEFLASRANRRRTGPAENVTMPRSNPADAAESTESSSTAVMSPATLRCGFALLCGGTEEPNGDHHNQAIASRRWQGGSTCWQAISF